MEIKGTLNHSILAAGGTVTIPTISKYNVVNLTSGTVTLLASQTYTTSGTPVDGMGIQFNCSLTGLTLNGNTLTIMGESISQAILTNTSFTVVSYYSASAAAFITTVTPNFSDGLFIETGHIAASAITTAKIAADAVSLEKMADITRGSIIVGGTGNAPTLRDFKTSGRIPIGDGTDIQSVAMSGDVTISSSGVTTIGAGVVETSMLAFSLASYLEVTRTLTSAEILALRTTEQELIAAPGSNKYIELVSASACLNYGAATYNAGTDLLNLEINGIAVWTFPNNFVEATANVANQGTRVDGAALALNTALKARMSSADPTTGDSTITIKVIYRINNLV